MTNRPEKENYFQKVVVKWITQNGVICQGGDAQWHGVINAPMPPAREGA